MSSILIGWASKDITPSKPANLWGQFPMRIAEKIKDPISLTALSVSVGNDSFIWISCDLCEIIPIVLDEARAKVKKLIPDFPVEKLIINTTHTHTAPDAFGNWYPSVPAGVMTPEEYRNFLTDKIAEASAESWKNRKEGGLSWGFGYAVTSHNRRAVYFETPENTKSSLNPGFNSQKYAQMYGNTNTPAFKNIEGGVENAVNMLFTYDKDNKLTGAVINIPCPSQETEHLSEVSADFWHEARIAIRKQYGENLFILPQCSAAGDLSPHLLYNKNANARMLKLKGISSRQEIANRIKASFDDIYQWAKNDIRTDLNFKHTVKTLPLKRRVITAEEYVASKQALEKIEKDPNAYESVKFRLRRVLERYEEQKHSLTLDMEMHVVRVGGAVFVTNSAELFLDFAIRIVAQSPADQTFVTQLASGGSSAYLPTDKAEGGEGYSACIYCNEICSKGGDDFVKEAVKTIKELYS